MNASKAFEIVQRAQAAGQSAAPVEGVCQALEVLVNATIMTYTNMSAEYSALRRDEPSDWDMPMLELLLSEVRNRVKTGRLVTMDGKWKLLDLGAGHGRDLRYFASHPDISPVGIEISEGFLEILGNLEHKGQIPPNSYLALDIRRLVGIPSTSFACVRDSATIQHLPVLWKGLGADESVAEGFRVLQPGGIFSTIVKRGHGLKFIDTNEGLGARLYQLFTPDSLKDLLQRNGLRVIHMEERTEPRPSGNIDWVFALSERPEE